MSTRIPPAIKWKLESTSGSTIRVSSGIFWEFLRSAMRNTTLAAANHTPVSVMNEIVDLYYQIADSEAVWAL
jgi:hypothetical protein